MLIHIVIGVGLNFQLELLWFLSLTQRLSLSDELLFQKLVLDLGSDFSKFYFNCFLFKYFLLGMLVAAQVWTFFGKPLDLEVCWDFAEPVRLINQLFLWAKLIRYLVFSFLHYCEWAVFATLLFVPHRLHSHRYNLRYLLTQCSLQTQHYFIDFPQFLLVFEVVVVVDMIVLDW